GGDLGAGAEGAANEVAGVDEIEVPMALVQVGQDDALNRDVEPALFAQLTSQRLVRAFPMFDPSAGQAPGMAPSVRVLEQEHPAAVVEDECRRSGQEVWVAPPDGEPAQPLWQRQDAPQIEQQPQPHAYSLLDVAPRVRTDVPITV